MFTGAQPGLFLKTSVKRRTGLETDFVGQPLDIGPGFVAVNNAAIRSPLSTPLNPWVFDEFIASETM